MPPPDGTARLEPRANGYSTGVSDLGSALKKAAAALERARVPYAVGGSLASWARGGPPSRRDVDLMVKPEDAEAALVALDAAGLRTERPPEQWLYKAWDGDVLIDVIFEPAGLDVDDELLARTETLNIDGMRVPVMAMEDVMTTMLLALSQHALDLEPLVAIARALREQVDWEEVARRTAGSPYARAFIFLVEELGLSRELRAPRSATTTRVRVA
jgi:hypothetical protein